MLCSKPSSLGNWIRPHRLDFLADGRTQNGWRHELTRAARATKRQLGWQSVREAFAAEPDAERFRSSTTMQTLPKRPYTRRNTEDRLRELEAKLAAAKARLEAEKERESPLYREWQKASKVLRKFIQTATDAGRSDIAISAQAFSAGIERSMRMTADEQNGRRRTRNTSDDDAG